MLFVLPSQQVIVRRLDPNSLSSSRDMASNQPPRPRLLPLLVLLKCRSSIRQAVTLHKPTPLKLLNRLITLWPLPHNLEWQQASPGHTKRDQVLLHLLEVP